MQNKSKHFISCFICGVDIDDKKIVLDEANHKQQYFIFRDIATNDTIDNFKTWFSDVYMKCIPATPTIIDYDITEKEGECILIVNKLVSPLMKNESKE